MTWARGKRWRGRGHPRRALCSQSLSRADVRAPARPVPRDSMSRWPLVGASGRVCGRASPGPPTELRTLGALRPVGHRTDQGHGDPVITTMNVGVSTFAGARLFTNNVTDFRFRNGPGAKFGNANGNDDTGGADSYTRIRVKPIGGLGQKRPGRHLPASET